MKYFFTFVIIAIIAIICFPENIFASEFHMVINPSIYEITTKHERTITLPYSVTNLGDPSIFSLQVYKLKPLSSGKYDLEKYIPEEKDISFRLETPSYSLDTPFLIRPNQKIDVDLVVTIPKNIQEKDYYFTFVAESAPESQFIQESAVVLDGAIGSNIFITVSESGTRSIDASITQFAPLAGRQFSWGGNDYAIFDAFEPIPFRLVLSNKGKNFIQTTGTITLLNALDKKPAGKNDSVNIVKTYIPAQNQRTLKSAADKMCQGQSPPKACANDYSAISRGNYLGFYRASAVVYVNENAKILYNHAYVIVFPFVHALLASLALAIFLGILYYLKMTSEEKSDS